MKNKKIISSPAQFIMQAKIIKAMAHPTRLFIINELSQNKKCVCELRDMIGADMSTVSRHLSVLKNAGIIEENKNGTSVYYSLKCPCILRFFSCIETVIETQITENLSFMKSQNKSKRNGR